MILKCNREKLSEACSVVQRAVPSKSTIPALEGILLSAKDDTLTLSAVSYTHLDVYKRQL